MIYSILLISSILIAQSEEPNYTFAFYRIDNKVEISVNGDIVYESPETEHNPELKGKLRYDITKHLTKADDQVIIKLYNGFYPYHEDQKDVSWEIEYSLLKDGVEIDVMWDQEDDSRVGLVFQETYTL